MNNFELIKKGIRENIFQFSLWMLTLFFMIILIILFVVFSGTKIDSEINTIAAFGTLFTISLIVSIFFTVFIKIKEKKSIRIKRSK